jgi:acyl-coenzyme A thioesterase PaaI-like protein
VVMRASCYKVTRHVCFVRGVAYTTDESDPVASLSATFARKS